MARLSWPWDQGSWLYTGRGFLHRQLNPGPVNHASINLARRRVTSLIETNSLPLCQSTNFIVHDANIFRYFEPFTRGSQVWKTDGQTDIIIIIIIIIISLIKQLTERNRDNNKTNKCLLKVVCLESCCSQSWQLVTESDDEIWDYSYDLFCWEEICVKHGESYWVCSRKGYRPCRQPVETAWDRRRCTGRAG